MQRGRRRAPFHRRTSKSAKRHSPTYGKPMGSLSTPYTTLRKRPTAPGLPTISIPCWRKRWQPAPIERRIEFVLAKPKRSAFGARGRRAGLPLLHATHLGRETLPEEETHCGN